MSGSDVSPEIPGLNPRLLTTTTTPKTWKLHEPDNTLHVCPSTPTADIFSALEQEETPLYETTPRRALKLAGRPS